MEGRCDLAQDALNKALGLTYEQCPVHYAVLCSDPAKQIMWIHFEEEIYAKKVIMRAAKKKPEGFSVKQWCPTVAYERRSAMLKAIKDKKEQATNDTASYQVRLGVTDLQLWCKANPGAPWTKVAPNALCEDLPDLLAQPWTAEKLEQERQHFLKKREGPTPPPQRGRSMPFSWVESMEAEDDSGFLVPEEGAAAGPQDRGTHLPAVS